ncbi:unnamed protein product [Moneuplotes crassus]|uniref:Uncharacterized protein n=1 Tax=Euplotes crassus TaxID=5936 RepID=A0AAD1Y6D8_EUPCR|nr:unnamed protein product [Moneuplotes crassus]
MFKITKTGRYKSRLKTGTQKHSRRLKSLRITSESVKINPQKRKLDRSNQDLEGEKSPPTPVMVERSPKKSFKEVIIRKRPPPKLESAQKHRREIKISLVEGIRYESPGKDHAEEVPDNTKFLELNYRKRGKEDSFSIGPSLLQEEPSDVDFVAKFIEQAAAASGISYNMTGNYSSESPIKRRRISNNPKIEKSDEQPQSQKEGEGVTFCEDSSKIKFSEVDKPKKDNSLSHSENPIKSISSKKDSFRDDTRNYGEETGKTIFQNSSIDNKLDVKEKVNHSNRKTLDSNSIRGNSRKSVDNTSTRRGQILSNMNFNLSCKNSAYIDREQRAREEGGKVPFINNLSQNKYGHLPNIQVDIPRTHKELTAYNNPRGTSSHQNQRSKSKSKPKRVTKAHLKDEMVANDSHSMNILIRKKYKQTQPEEPTQKRIKSKTVDKRKIKKRDKPFAKMWFNPFQGFYAKDDPNLKVSSFVQQQRKVSKSSKGFRIRHYGQTSGNKKTFRPHTGNRNNSRGTYAILDTFQGHTRVNSMANSRGFQDSEAKFDSVHNLKNHESFSSVKNISENQGATPKEESGFKDFLNNVPSIQEDPQSTSLLQKISLSDQKAMLSYNINQDECEKNRRILVQIKKQIESDKIASKMHKKVLSWQNKKLNFNTSFEDPPKPAGRVGSNTEQSPPSKMKVEYAYNNEKAKKKQRQHPRNPYSKGFKTAQTSHRRTPVTRNSKEKLWEEYTKQQAQPGLIGILKYNQDRQDALPDSPKKNLAEHLKKKSLARFNLDINHDKDARKTKLIEERRMRISNQVDKEMREEFFKPSLDTSTKYSKMAVLIPTFKELM